ncbi:hypothetical protein HGRIS_007120 [Hohenbuehelia grisea]|uniref:Fungal lipase-type domain-containing protein n=1 Tax=Hohenbuehelia grisea TaxID=104357 RepID=A0ABR3JBR1_9AGAR
MLFPLLSLALASAFAQQAQGAISLVPRNELNVVTPLSQAQASTYMPFSLFAQASYCQPKQIEQWNCPGCEQLTGFKPTLTGGDGGRTRFHYVGFWPKEKAVVVVHQGTNPKSLKSIFTDLHVTKTRLDSEHFPGVDSKVQVHSGFAAAHAQSAPEILAEARRLLAQQKSRRVILVGHSLGGALAALDALSLRLNLPKHVDVQAVTYGMPRLGNHEFVKLFDEKIPDFKRIIHQRVRRRQPHPLSFNLTRS